MLKAILRLRRDNDYNYAKIKDTFIPANGEICLVDTAREELRAVCGDGKSTFAQLEFLNDFIKKGYYKDDIFYKDKELTLELPKNSLSIYIDISTSYLYYYNGVSFVEIKTKTATALATSSEAGIMKLYNETGQNIDGTMTQKAITDELDQKVELTLKEDEELVIFEI